MTDQPGDLEKYNEMVLRALQRLTRWAFPDSQVERKDQVNWLLWHTTENNKKFIDVSVDLQMKKRKACIVSYRRFCTTSDGRVNARRFG